MSQSSKNKPIKNAQIFSKDGDFVVVRSSTMNRLGSIVAELLTLTDEGLLPSVDQFAMGFRGELDLPSIDNSLSLAEHLRLIRMGLGYSGKDWAGVLGVSQAIVCDWEKGRKIPCVERITRIRSLSYHLDKQNRLLSWWKIALKEQKHRREGSKAAAAEFVLTEEGVDLMG